MPPNSISVGLPPSIENNRRRVDWNDHKPGQKEVERDQVQKCHPPATEIAAVSRQQVRTLRTPNVRLLESLRTPSFATGVSVVLAVSIASCWEVSVTGVS